MMKVKSNGLHIASCAVHHGSATIGIRVADMQIACVSCWLLAKVVATHVVYSVSMSYDAACPRCVSTSYIHSCMPGKDADMLYSRLDLLLPYVCGKAFHSGCADIDTVDAETNEIPVRSFKVSRNHQGKLFLDGMEKALANRGLVLLGIGEGGFPAHENMWTINTFNTIPVQLIVGPEPGMWYPYLV